MGIHSLSAGSTLYLPDAKINIRRCAGDDNVQRTTTKRKIFWTFLDQRPKFNCSRSRKAIVVKTLLNIKWISFLSICLFWFFRSVFFFILFRVFVLDIFRAIVCVCDVCEPLCRSVSLALTCVSASAMRNQHGLVRRAQTIPPHSIPTTCTSTHTHTHSEPMLWFSRATTATIHKWVSVAVSLAHTTECEIESEEKESRTLPKLRNSYYNQSAKTTIDRMCVCVWVWGGGNACCRWHISLNDHNETVSCTCTCRTNEKENEITQLETLTGLRFAALASTPSEIQWCSRSCWWKNNFRFDVTVIYWKLMKEKCVSLRAGSLHVLRAHFATISFYHDCCRFSSGKCFSIAAEHVVWLAETCSQLQPTTTASLSLSLSHSVRESAFQAKIFCGKQINDKWKCTTHSVCHGSLVALTITMHSHSEKTTTMKRKLWADEVEQKERESERERKSANK